MECLLRSPSKLDVRTGGSQQKLTAHFASSSIRKWKFDVSRVSKTFFGHSIDVEAFDKNSSMPGSLNLPSLGLLRKTINKLR